MSVFGIASGIDYARGFIGGAAGSAIKAVANGIADAVGSILEVLGTLWIRLDVPNVWSADGGTSATVEFLHSEVAPIVGLLAVFGILVGAARLAWAQRIEPGRDLVAGLFTLVLVTGCGVPFIGLLVSGSDALAQSIVADAGTRGFGESVTAMLALSGPTLAPMLLIVLGGIALLMSLVQIALMVFRAAMLVVLAGLLPVAASMTTTQTGREHFRKYCAWVIALVAYKPTAALIYAAAFRLIGTHDLSASGAASVLIGLSLMVMAVVALPALVKFLVPAVSALSRGGGGAGHLAMAGAMAMPTGARILAPRSSSGGGAAASPGPSGASGAGVSGGGGAPGSPGGSSASGGPGAPGGGGAPGVGASGASGPSGSAVSAAGKGAAGAAAGPAGAAAAAGAQAAQQGVANATQHATNPTSTEGKGGPDGSR